MSEVNMQAVPVIAPSIQMALDYSRNFATAKPNIGRTEKEHIEGLANLLERTALENSGLQALLTAADERADQQSWTLLEVEAACDLAMSAMDDDERGANFVKIVAAIKAKAALKPAEGGGDA